MLFSIFVPSCIFFNLIFPDCISFSSKKLTICVEEKGISPYSYLETIRIGKAKELLQAGVLPAEAAARTGFSDQSHLGNAFKRYIGLTPKQYWRIFEQERNKIVPAPNSAQQDKGELDDESIG